jgi:PAS domain S-box-containing protein
MRKEYDRIRQENEELRSRLAEAEDALNAIRNGEVDAIVVSGESGQKIFSLTSAETPYRIFIENMEEGAITLTTEGVILYCNPRFITMTGLPEKKIVGNKIFSFIEKEDLEKFRSFFKLGTTESKAGEFRLISSSEQVEFCNFTVNVLPEEIEGDLFAIVSNITRLKKYEQEIEVKGKQFEDTLNLMPAFVILVSAEDHSITFANRYFRDHYGDPAESPCYELLLGKTQKCALCGTPGFFSDMQPTHEEMVDSRGRIFQITRFPYTDVTNKPFIFEMGIDITEKRNLEKIILAKTFETEEKEKKRLARDFHDDLGPMLATIKLRMEMFADGEEINSCSDMLTECIDKLRIITHGQSPILVENYGLYPAVYSYIRNIEKTKRISFNLTSNMEEVRFKTEFEVHLYRIITELVNNTIKYSGAANAFLDMKAENGSIRVVYSDDGPGYEIEMKPTAVSGTGVLNIKSRVKIMNGKISFLRIDGHTIVVINVDLPRS